MIDVEELDRLLQEATPGPWELVDYFNHDHLSADVTAGCLTIGPVFADRDGEIHGTPADLQSIVALRNAAPELLKAWRVVETLSRESAPIASTEYPPGERAGGHCVFCYFLSLSWERLDAPENHEDFCIWRRAKELVERSNVRQLDRNEETS